MVYFYILKELFFYLIFVVFLYCFHVLVLKIIFLKKYIILMYFKAKYIIKNNNYHIFKHILKLI
jgi:hypothetical protein